ncbi:MAG: hypothetical protein KDK50_06205, partial [Chlamydiia bacterium]|nr:hypothetical protein [Chlamydiia bacterium]
THERIDGHWIILDEINLENSTADIRDPNTGCAFRLSMNELKANVSVEDALGYQRQHFIEISSS